MTTPRPLTADLRSQSHRTDQGSSKSMTARTELARASSSRNPTVQIRAVPSYGEFRQRCTIREVAIPPYRSGQFQVVVLTEPTTTVRVAIPPYRSGQFQASGRLDGDREAALKVAIPPYRSGQFQGRAARRPVVGRATHEVAIPPYRSGKFQAESSRAATATVIEVAIPPYRSGKFQASHQRSKRCGHRSKSQSHRTDQGSSKYRDSTRASSNGAETVAIPPYRSGQFQDKVRRMLETAATARLSQSHRTDQGSSK